MKLTAEQQAVLESNSHLVINAVAGSGKTTTLVEYAGSRPTGSRILYLAFNNSVRTEARHKFDTAGLQHVVVETAHSLAYKYTMAGRRQELSHGFKSYELAEHLKIETGDRHVDYLIAQHVIRYMSYWCNSDAQKVQQLDYLKIITEPKAQQFVKNYQDRILLFTRQALADMHNGKLAITHDFYLKKFQLDAPVIPYDYILFDEGQDASGAMLDVFLKQPAIKVIVGDVHQQIYGWRFAVNSLQQVDFPLLTLSQSFRFNDEVALVANNILRWKHTLLNWPKPVRVVGSDVDTETIESKATLGRSNLALMGAAIENWQSKVAEKVYFEGNISSYTFADEGASMYDILNLQQGKKGQIRDKLIAGMASLKELEEYIEKTDDNSLKVLVEVVKKYGSNLPSLINALKNQHTEHKQDAEMIYSTVHRCKGMEYDEVIMLDDFMHEDKLKRALAEMGGNEASAGNKARLAEEVNLLYVGVTRARARLKVPLSVSPFKTVQVTAVAAPVPPPQALPSKYGMRRSYDREIEALYELSMQKQSDRAYARRNAGKPWKPADLDALEALFRQNKSISDLALEFGRSNISIRAKLRELGLADDADDLFDIPF